MRTVLVVQSKLMQYEKEITPHSTHQCISISQIRSCLEYRILHVPVSNVEGCRLYSISEHFKLGVVRDSRTVLFKLPRVVLIQVWVLTIAQTGDALIDIRY